MANLVFVRLVFMILIGIRKLHAVPLDATTVTPSAQAGDDATQITAELNSSKPNVSPAQQTEPEAAASEQKKISASISPSVENSGNNNLDSSTAANSMYAGFLTPETIQQYINQFGAAYPGYATYPAPFGYATAALPPPPPANVGPIYPGPYVVQTGYEGYLVPATEPNSNASNALLSPFTYLSNLFSMLMMSALFRIVVTVIGAIAMIFFRGALSRLVCNLTPLCQVTTTAVEYLKSEGNAEHVGRMIAEGMTPERVRRATAFVHEALRKYQELQKSMGNEEKDN